MKLTTTIAATALCKSCGWSQEVPDMEAARVAMRDHRATVDRACHYLIAIPHHQNRKA